MLGLEPGTLFGERYQIIRSIGAGGMGAVYLACDPRYEDFFVALKVLYPGVIKTREARERFRNEIIASYRVNHRNVVRAYEYFDEEDTQAYAMEYVDGGDLLQRMRTGKHTGTEALHYLKQMAMGLDAIHSAGIVHRDFKPENILITKTDVIKIADFGVARLRGANTLTQAGAMVGTPKYLAPEYVETGECDHRGDIYALGVIGYELLAGQSPFRAGSRVSLMVERLKTKATPLDEYAPEAPADLVKVIEKAMRVSILQRYQSARELIDDLELIEKGEPVNIEESPPSAGYTMTGLRSDIYQGVLANSSAYVPEKEVNSSMLSNKLVQRAALAGLILLVAVVGFVWPKAETPQVVDKHSVLDLPNGEYQGTVSGVLSDRGKYPFQLWRTKKGAYILLGKAHCRVEKISDQNQFSCGDLRFEIALSSVEKKSAVGTIRELGWNTKGTFSLEESKS